MDPEKPSGPPKTPAAGAEPGFPHNPAVDDLFRQLTQDLHRPKPSSEAVAAAVQTIQKLALHTDIDQAVNAVAQGGESRPCHACGSVNPAANRFCSICGVSLKDASAPGINSSLPGSEPDASAHPGPHQYHHHYHHHYFYSEGAVPTGVADARPAASIPARDTQRRTPTAGTGSLSRAEAAVRKLIQDWALACNNKHLDDVVSLYSADAIVLRSNVPAVRGTAAIREYFFGVLDAGLGDIETEPLRVEVFGDIAYEAGRGQMLVPVAMNKRREERGKYLMMLIKQSGEWKILMDCWGSDLTLAVGSEPAAAKAPAATVSSAVRPARKP